MYKSKTKQRESVRKAVKKHRNKLATNEGITKGITPFIPYHVVEKLADEKWRGILTVLKVAFTDSHDYEDAKHVMFCFCGTPLSDVFEWLEKTPNV